MNYITSCPKCDTQFILNDELIQAHRGKVQCGNCEHVFNAKNRLTEVADDITSAEEYQASLEEDTSFEDQENPIIEEIILQSDDGDFTTDNAEIDHYIGGANATETTQSDQQDAPAIIDDFTKHVSQLKKTKTKSKHPLLLGIVSLLLMFAAASQTIYHKRVKIAAQYPQFKPLLIKACVPLHCKIGLPKELDFLTIGDADMQENSNYQSVINFSSMLRNTANYAQAYPSIELTLTNSDDKIAIKKLIRPEDYLTPDQKIEDGIAARQTSLVKLALYIHETNVAGYRLLLLY